MSKARHARPSKMRKVIRIAGAVAIPGAAVTLAVTLPSHATPQTQAAFTRPHPDDASITFSRHRDVTFTGTLDYTVRSGDTLSSVAQVQCGNPADWTGIWRASRISNPDSIYTGEQLALDCRQVKVSYHPATIPSPAGFPAVTPSFHSHAGGTLSFSGLEALWMAVGGPSWAASDAAAVAMCESGGRQYAQNPYSGAAGYWQIHGQVVPGDVFNPMVNALNAVAKFRASGDTFAQWTCQP